MNFRGLDYHSGRLVFCSILGSLTPRLRVFLP